MIESKPPKTAIHYIRGEELPQEKSSLPSWEMQIGWEGRLGQASSQRRGDNPGDRCLRQMKVLLLLIVFRLSPASCGLYIPWKGHSPGPSGKNPTSQGLGTEYLWQDVWQVWLHSHLDKQESFWSFSLYVLQKKRGKWEINVKWAKICKGEKRETWCKAFSFPALEEPSRFPDYCYLT